MTALTDDPAAACPLCAAHQDGCPCGHCVTDLFGGTVEPIALTAAERADMERAIAAMEARAPDTRKPPGTDPAA